MKRICVFAGSNPGHSPAYSEAASELGLELVRRNIELVYGGSKVGLMGRLADTVMANGGRVIGVMPKGLFRGEIVHTGLTELREVANMHERKAMMAQLADGFIALPGGLGTFEELFEVLCWSQIGIHEKPIGLLNVQGFYTPLYELILHSIKAGFAREANKDLFVMVERPVILLDEMSQYRRPADENKWSELPEASAAAQV